MAIVLAALSTLPGFAMAQSVPVTVAGLPHPCVTAACAGHAWDALATGSSTSLTNNTLTVNQKGNSAIFNWQDFNITQGNTVNFVQPNNSAVALNRIFDPNQTFIDGRLTSNGQVYLLNPNGILFGKNAYVDVGGLIATTLNVADTRITSGLLSSTIVSDPVFATSVDPKTDLSTSAAAIAAGTAGSVKVMPGATLHAGGVSQDGTVVTTGRIFLFAPTVDNGGSIAVDGGGQAILAAGSKVYLGSSIDPALRGLLVEVNGGVGGVTVDLGGSVSVSHGNASLVGLAVNQNGSVSATSAIRENGSIILTAREATPSGTVQTHSSNQAPVGSTLLTLDNPNAASFVMGHVALGSGSSTVVRTDTSDTTLAPLSDASAAALRSTITIQGGSVSVGGNAPSATTLVEAHGGDVTISARQDVSSLYGVGSTALLGTVPAGGVNAGADVNVGSDARIDVSGLQGVAVDGSRNFVYIDRLTSTNLASSPLQRGGFLLGKGVYVNLAAAPSFIDVSNLQLAVAGTQAERNAAGGNIVLRAEEAVNVAKGAVLDVSGGSVNVSAAIGRTSQLIALNGAVIDISKASADTVYVGFADQLTDTLYSTREGINTSASFQAPGFSQIGGYVQGKSAGSIEIYAPQADLSGSLLAHTVAGTNPRLSTPSGGLLRIGSSPLGNLDLDHQGLLSRANILLATDAAALAAGMEPQAAGATIALDGAQLASNGFSGFSLTSDGIIDIAGKSTLALAPGGSLNAQGDRVDVNASISVPGGSVALSERPLSAGTRVEEGNSGAALIARSNLSLLAPGVTPGAVVMGAGSGVSVAGLWTNDSLLAPGTVPTAIPANDGGKISLSARLVDVSGAQFDVSAGATLSQQGQFSGGAAGSLSISASDRLTVLVPNAQDNGQLVLGDNFADRIAGFGARAGGALSISAPALQLGGTLATTGAGPAPVLVDAGIADRGFATFSLSGYMQLSLGQGVQFAPSIATFQYNPALLGAASSGTLLSALTPQLPLLPQSYLPASITLATPSGLVGTLSVPAGSSIDAGARGSVVLKGGSATLIDGTVRASGGTVSASIAALPTDTSGFTVDPAARVLDLGNSAVIDVAGVSEVSTNAQGVRSGPVLDGGTVTLIARDGTLAMAGAARIDAHGATGVIDLPGAANGPRQAQVVNSSGGTVILESQATVLPSGLLITGRFNAAGGGAGAIGGDLSVVSDGTTLSIDPTGVDLSPFGTSLSVASFGGNSHVTSGLVNVSGFDRIWLASDNAIAVSQAISLTARESLVLDTQSIQANGAGATLNLSAPYVALGAGPVVANSIAGGSAPPLALATTGPGSLTVQAQQIDLTGNFTLQGIGTASLHSSGDVALLGATTNSSTRVAGSLNFAGNLEIDAQQVYTATQTDFGVNFQGAAGDATVGQVLFGSTGAPGIPPLSAGGSLSITSPDVSIQTSVSAPQGSMAINAVRSFTLGATGTLSVSGAAVVPYGSVLNGTQWTYSAKLGYDPNTYVLGSPSSATALPAKGISIASASVAIAPGSSINVSAGGDTLASEFIAGPGGPTDVSLNTLGSGTGANPYFAILPSRAASFAPYDPQIYAGISDNPALTGAQQFPFSLGRTLTLAAGSGIAAGTYTILPAKYALLPGAYAVKAFAGSASLAPGTTFAEGDGTVVVAGKLGYAAADTQQSLWSNYRVYTGAQFRQLAQFNDYLGSRFFDAAALASGLGLTRGPQDAGTLSIAGQAMTLDGQIQAGAPQGRGVDFSLSAPDIVVSSAANGTGAPQGQLQVNADYLSALDAATLVLGAVDSRSGTAMNLSNLANTVTLNASAKPLSASELVLAASGAVTLGDGAALLASGSATPLTRSVVLPSDGAALIAGTGNALPAVIHASGTGVTGNLSLGANASVSAASVVFDATGTQSYAPSIQLATGNLALSAQSMAFGSAPTAFTGLVISDALLAQLGAAGNLTLASSGGMQAFGSATIGALDTNGLPLLNSLSLLTPALTSSGAADARLVLNAGHINLEGSATASTLPQGSGSGALLLNAIGSTRPGADGSIAVSGVESLSGFSQVNVQALAASTSAAPAVGGDLVFQGAVGASAALEALGASTVQIDAARLTAARGVNAQITTPGSLTVLSNGLAPAPQTTQVGAALAVQASSIDFAGRIDLPAGTVSLAATGPAGAGDVVLEGGSSLRVAGMTQGFASASADLSAGSILLSSAGGKITQSAGSTLDLAGAGKLGDAGTLQLLAPNGTVDLGGSMLLQAGTAAQGASVTVDAGTLANSSQIVQAIASGSGAGVANEVSLRARSGDITLAATDTVRAARISLEADGGGLPGAGSIVVSGQLLAGGPSGGSVALYANDQILLNAGSVIDASSSAANQYGGSVYLSARVNAAGAAATTLDGIVVSAGATVDVSAHGAATDPTRGGIITLRSTAVNGNDVAIAPVLGNLLGARQDIVEGVQIAQQTGDITLDASAGGLMSTEAAALQAYMAAVSANGVAARLGLAGNPALSLRPGLEITTPGAITVTGVLDFAAGLAGGAPTWRYGAGTAAASVPGELTLRAGGQLSIGASVSDGFASSATNAKIFTAGDSWSYGFTAGADLGAADAARTSAAADLVIGTGSARNSVLVRTGTGNISLSAGRDVVLDNVQGQQGNVVYTAGLGNVVPSVPFVTAGAITPTLVSDGGSLSVSAARNVDGSDASAGFNLIGSTQFINEWLYRGGLGTTAFASAVWVNFASFQQGFGALGGGNLVVRAGGDIARVGAVVPDSLYAVNGVASQFNAGALDVRAGGQIVQGLYYDESGSARLRADQIASSADPQALNQAISAGDQSLIGVRLASGSAALSLQSRTGLEVNDSINPTAFLEPIALISGRAKLKYDTSFFTYGAGSSVDMRVSAGNLLLDGLSADRSPALTTALDNIGDIMAPRVSLTSFGGDVAGNFGFRGADRDAGDSTAGSFFRLFPAADGNLSLLADGNLVNTNFVMSQANPAILPSLLAPAKGLFASSGQNPSILDTPQVAALALHAGDANPVEVVARTGSIDTVFLDLPKMAQITAGQKIYSSQGSLVAFDIQNADASSLSTISAGSNLDLSAYTSNHIYISGPGAAQILSGASMDLGTGPRNEVLSVGNRFNRNLPAEGASLIVAVGVGQDANGFANAPDYRNLVLQYLQNDAFAAEGNLSAGLNAQVLASLPTTDAYQPLVALLKGALAARAAGTPEPLATLTAQLDALPPSLLATGALRLATAVQDVSNTRFVSTRNADTFAPAYAVFTDLFPQTANGAAVIRGFAAANPFSTDPQAASLQSQVLAGLPADLAQVVGIGIASGGIGQAGSAFEKALAALDPSRLQSDARLLLAKVLSVAGTETDRLRTAGQLDATAGSPFAKALTALGAAFSSGGPAGINDLSMVYSQIKVEQTGDAAVLAPQGGVKVGQATPPANAITKPAANLGILTLGGGDIIGMVRDNFDVFQSRVFTVAGGDISLWSSLQNIDAGKGARDLAVAPAPVLVTDPSTGVQYFDIAGAVTGSGIGALQTQPNQPVSNIALMAPAGYVDAGEAGIRAATGSVTLGTNLVINAGNIQSATGVSGGAVVVAAPPPLPSSSVSNAAEKALENANREAQKEQEKEAKRVEKERHRRVTGEFLGYGSQ